MRVGYVATICPICRILYGTTAAIVQTLGMLSANYVTKNKKITEQSIAPIAIQGTPSCHSNAALYFWNPLSMAAILYNSPLQNQHAQSVMSMCIASVTSGDPVHTTKSAKTVIYT